MRTFLVNIPWAEYGDTKTMIGGEIRAKSFTEAKRVAEEQGYELLFEMPSQQELNQMRAVAEKRLSTEH